MKRAVLSVVAVVVALGAGLAAGQEGRISGTVAHKERMALPPTAQIELTLEDVSRAGAAATVIASTTIATEGKQVPIPFELAYDPARIDPRSRYNLRARILDGTDVLFRSTEATLVLTQGHGNRVTMMLTRASGQTPPPRAGGAGPAKPPALQSPQPNLLTNLPATFVGTLPCADCPGIKYELNLFPDDSFFLRTTYIDRPPTANTDEIGSWVLSSDRRVLVIKGSREGPPQFFSIRDGRTLRKLDMEAREIESKNPYELKRTATFQKFEVRLPMRGMYQYMADAGIFIECSTGQQWPVATEAENVALQNMYLEASKKPGAPMLVMLEGRVASRPPMEGPGMVATLIPEKPIKTMPGESCPARFAAAPFHNTHWRLTRLGDTAIAGPSNPKEEPAVTFESDTGQFSGSGGCNRMIGSFHVSGDTLSMKSAGTLRACPVGMETEAAFGKALANTRTFRIIGRLMEFHDGQGKLVAAFQAR